RGDLPEYSVPTYKGMGDVPRAGNDSGGGQLGNAIHCKPHGANDWLYVVVQEAVWEDLAKRIGPDVGMPDMASDPRFAKIGDRRKNQNLMWTLINKFAEKYTKRELMAILNPLDVPCGPIMSTQDLANDGQQDFGKAVLEAFLARGDEVAGVFCAPEKEGAKADPLKAAALEKGLKIFQFQSLRNKEALDAMRALNADIGIMAFVLQFAPQEFVKIPKKGTIQYHPSLLPKYQIGRAH